MTTSPLSPSPCEAGRGWREAPGEGLSALRSGPSPRPSPRFRRERERRLSFPVVDAVGVVSPRVAGKRG
jgi:hypothetical protein